MKRKYIDHGKYYSNFSEYFYIIFDNKKGSGKFDGDVSLLHAKDLFDSINVIVTLNGNADIHKAYEKITEEVSEVISPEFVYDIFKCGTQTKTNYILKEKNLDNKKGRDDRLENVKLYFKFRNFELLRDFEYYLLYFIENKDVQVTIYSTIKEKTVDDLYNLLEFKKY